MLPRKSLVLPAQGGRKNIFHQREDIGVSQGIWLRVHGVRDGTVTIRPEEKRDSLPRVTPPIDMPHQGIG